MARWAAGLRGRRRTCEGCRDLHQTRSVLAAVSGRGRGLREREPPSFGPMQEGARICFEMVRYGQKTRGDPASEALLIALQHIVVQCNMVSPGDGVKNRVWGVQAHGHRRHLLKMSPPALGWGLKTIVALLVAF